MVGNVGPGRFASETTNGKVTGGQATIPASSIDCGTSGWEDGWMGGMGEWVVRENGHGRMDVAGRMGRGRMGGEELGEGVGGGIGCFGEWVKTEYAGRIHMETHCVHDLPTA